VESQQLAPRITALESRVSTLEDEGKIIKGEVKQILLEIRSAVLSRDNPFDDNPKNRAAPQLRVVPAEEPPPAPSVEAAAQSPERAPAPVAPAPPAAVTAAAPVVQAPAPVVAEPEAPHWSLLTIAGISAWAEDAMRRLGALRFEILLDLCETAGHITPDARTALSRATQLDVASPEHAPSTNETVSVLRQLEALLGEEDGSIALPRVLGI
jgi:hypothetical protein